MLTQRDREHQNEGANVRERGQGEGVGAARPISSREVSRAPEKYGDDRVSRRCELNKREHAGRE